MGWFGAVSQAVSAEIIGKSAAVIGRACSARPSATDGLLRSRMYVRVWLRAGGCQPNHGAAVGAWLRVASQAR